VRVSVIYYAQAVEKITVPVVVTPIVIVGGYSLADWVAGQKSGQVLLGLGKKGWHVLAMENSSIADARYLNVRYKVPKATAAELVTEIHNGEHRQGGARR
jgi:hypothetical protein